MAGRLLSNHESRLESKSSPSQVGVPTLQELLAPILADGASDQLRYLHGRLHLLVVRAEEGDDTGLRIEPAHDALTSINTTDATASATLKTALTELSDAGAAGNGLGDAISIQPARSPAYDCGPTVRSNCAHRQAREFAAMDINSIFSRAWPSRTGDVLAVSSPGAAANFLHEACATQMMAPMNRWMPNTRNWEVSSTPATKDMTSTTVGHADHATPSKKSMRTSAETSMHIDGSRQVRQKK
ncbi:hypothetical protein NUW54_g13932 [Trametes sanguinea]|uniref:Uncharacterized protein n=1 Tax=Trametes sanguinea TaxID=158606 RepID=A0ACC1MI39_9APHY|nr:hypothetical protein NUW54_g13932 [Trametes sanguinea]